MEGKKWHLCARKRALVDGKCASQTRLRNKKHLSALAKGGRTTAGKLSSSALPLGRSSPFCIRQPKTEKRTPERQQVGQLSGEVTTMSNYICMECGQETNNPHFDLVSGIVRCPECTKRAQGFGNMRQDTAEEEEDTDSIQE